MRVGLAALMVAALHGCAERAEPDAAPTSGSGGYNMIDPVRVDDAQREAGTTPGAWRTGTVDGAQALLFAAPGAAPAFAMYCAPRRGLVLERRGLTPTGTIKMMQVAIGGTRRALAVNPVRGDVPTLRAEVPYSDELAARLQQGATPLSIDVGEGQRLRLPASPLVPALAADCARA